MVVQESFIVSYRNQSGGEEEKSFLAVLQSAQEVGGYLDMEVVWWVSLPNCNERMENRQGNP